MKIISYYLGHIFIIVGFFLIFTSVIGVKRMPDVFCKIHATSIADSLGYPLCYLGLFLISCCSVLSFKYILFIILSLLLSPIATFSIAKSINKKEP